MSEEGVKTMKLRQLILNKKVYKAKNMTVSMDRSKKVIEIVLEG